MSALTTDVIAAALPRNHIIAVTEIAGEVAQLSVIGERSLEAADRAVIESDESFGRGADFLAAVNKNIKDAEISRMAKTKPLDNAKSQIMSLYGSATAKLALAKATMTGKMDVYRRAENERKRVEAEAAARAAEEEALRLAQAQQALGDQAGADQVLEEAADVVAVIEQGTKLAVTGQFGATASTRTRKVGTVVDPLDFLKWLVAHPLAPGATEVIYAIKFPQRELNALAAEVLKFQQRVDALGAGFGVRAEVMNTPGGFKAEEIDSLDVRR